MFIESQTKRKLKILFVSKEFEEFLKFHGIQYQKLAPYSPQKNGVDEQVNQTIVEATCNMLQNTGLSPKFWAKVVNIAVYLKTRSSHKVVSEMALDKMCSEKKLFVKHLRIFGCATYA